MEYLIGTISKDKHQWYHYSCGNKGDDERAVVKPNCCKHACP